MNHAMASWNALFAGQKVILEFTFKVDAEAFARNMRVVHHRQHKVLVDTGILCQNDKPQSLAITILKSKDKDSWKLTMELCENRRRKGNGPISFTILESDDDQ